MYLKYVNLSSLFKSSGKDIFGNLVNPLSANPTKWSNTLKQFVGNLPRNCLSVFDHFFGLALKGLKAKEIRNGKFHLGRKQKSRVPQFGGDLTKARML